MAGGKTRTTGVAGPEHALERREDLAPVEGVAQESDVHAPGDQARQVKASEEIEKRTKKLSKLVAEARGISQVVEEWGVERTSLRLSRHDSGVLFGVVGGALGGAVGALSFVLTDELSRVSMFAMLGVVFGAAVALLMNRGSVQWKLERAARNLEVVLSKTKAEIQWMSEQRTVSKASVAQLWQVYNEQMGLYNRIVKRVLGEES